MTSALTVELAPGAFVRGFNDTGPLSSESNAGTAEGDHRGVHKWLAIPYGNPERWERITITPTWTGVKDCLEFSSRPVAGKEPLETMWDETPGSEPRTFFETSETDSLTLNVFKPATVQQSGKIPVIVFHHGGNLNVGHAGVYLHDPTELVRYSEALGKPIMVVTFNYRLNIFGFLDRPGAGNFGLHDQISALQWVQKYIDRFGGDPDNVTCWGSSAGAASLAVLLTRNRKISPDRLFKRLILQSGAVGTVPFIQSSHDEWKKLVEHHGLQGETEINILRALRDIPADDLLAYGQANAPAGGWRMTLEEGNDAVFNKMPLEALRQGNYDPHVEEILLSSNANEGSIFGRVYNLDREEIRQGHLSRFPGDIQTRLCELYPLKQDGGNGDVNLKSPFCQLLGDQLFNGPMELLHGLINSTPNTTTGCTIPIHRRLLRDTLPCPNPSIGNLGAYHTVDLAFVNQISTLLTDDISRKTAKLMGRDWIEFAYAGGRELHRVAGTGRLVYAGGELVEERVGVTGLEVKRMEHWGKVLDVRLRIR